MKSVGIITVAVALVALVTAPALGQRRSDKNQVIAVAYGTVIGIEVVNLESNAKKGAAVGGLVGVLASGGHKRTKRAATGAVVGGVGTRVLEGSNEAFEYTVRLVSGQDVKMITDQTGMRLGDCVSVEQGRSGNIRRVSSVHCEARDAEPTAEHRAEAAECAQAKQELANAIDEAAFDLALRKARILCEE
jgi:outer membrane lipoprotein SlyB